MEQIRCIKCGRPLRDPESIARGMGPECAGTNGRSSKKIPRPGFARKAVLIMRQLLTAAPLLPRCLLWLRKVSILRNSRWLKKYGSESRHSPKSWRSSQLILLIWYCLLPPQEQLPGTSRVTQKRKNSQVQYLRAGFCRKFAECASIYGLPSGQACPTHRDSK